MDDQGRFEIVNNAYADLFGYRRDELVGQHFGILFPPSDQESAPDWYVDRLRSAATTQQEHEMVAKGGDRLTVLIGSVQLAVGSTGRARHASFVMDITERKQAERVLAHAAHHDVLTGLPNRMLFGDRLEQALHSAGREKTPVALLLLDLDGFKAVNDSKGHAAGDMILRAVAARLQAAVRKSDSVARQGGDEFAILLPQTGEAGAAHVALQICAALAEAVPLDEGEARVGGSVGIAVYPEHGQDSESLLRSADQAMYGAKAAGGGYMVYGDTVVRAVNGRA